jgi:hypothetical protein
MWWFMDTMGTRWCVRTIISTIKLESDGTRTLFDFATHKVNCYTVHKRNPNRVSARQRYSRHLAGGHASPQQR